MANKGPIALLSGTYHPELARAISERLAIPLTPCTTPKFSNGEIGVNLKETVRDSDVYVIQSSTREADEAIMEMLILIAAAKSSSACNVTAVLPSFPYARNDKKDRSRAPITAKLLANLLMVTGCDHVITFDLHAPQIQGFFNIPVDNLFTDPLVEHHIRFRIPNYTEAVLVSPDPGGAKRTTTLADRLGIDFALIHTSRDEETVVGEVEGKTCVIIDDLMETGETVKRASLALHRAGAADIYAIVAHGILSPGALAMLPTLPLKQLIVTNTVPQDENLKGAAGKLAVLDISSVLAEAIRRHHHGESMRYLFGPAWDQFR